MQNINEKYSTEQTNRVEKEIYDRQLFMNNSFKILNHSDKIYQKKKKFSFILKLNNNISGDNFVYLFVFQTYFLWLKNQMSKAYKITLLCGIIWVLTKMIVKNLFILWQMYSEKLKKKYMYIFIFISLHKKYHTQKIGENN